jgi:hypothetical protein
MEHSYKNLHIRSFALSVMSASTLKSQQWIMQIFAINLPGNVERVYT